MIRRFLADADLNGSIVTGAVRRNANLDFKRAEEVPLASLSDDLVLAIAANDKRVLVSHDVNTMPNAFRECVRHRVSPGVILVPQQLSIAQAIGNILLVAEARGEQDLVNKLCLVPSLLIFGF